MKNNKQVVLAAAALHGEDGEDGNVNEGSDFSPRTQQRHREENQYWYGVASKQSEAAAAMVKAEQAEEQRGREQAGDTVANRVVVNGQRQPEMRGDTARLGVGILGGVGGHDESYRVATPTATATAGKIRGDDPGQEGEGSELSQSYQDDDNDDDEEQDEEDGDDSGSDGDDSDGANSDDANSRGSGSSSSSSSWEGGGGGGGGSGEGLGISGSAGEETDDMMEAYREGKEEDGEEDDEHEDKEEDEVSPPKSVKRKINWPRNARRSS